MASSLSLHISATSTLLFLSALITFTPPALSFSHLTAVNCNSHKFSKNRVYTNCLNLPTLAAQLHWTYTHHNHSLSIAFIAPIPTPDGWISWAINPTSTGMIGAQSFIAFKNSLDGSMAVKTFNITSYSSLIQSKLDFVVSDLSAEQSGQTMRIFAKLELPAELTTTINHAWQVGTTVIDGLPMKHDFGSENLDAYAPLDLLSHVSSSEFGAPAPAPIPFTDGASERPSNSDEQSISDGGKMSILCSKYLFLFFFMTSIIL